MKLVLMLLGLMSSLPLMADVYKCTDANGNKIYRATPCVEGQKKIELNVKTGGTTDLTEQENQQALSQQEEQSKDAQKKQEEDQAKQKLNQLKQESADETAKNQFLVKSNPQQYSAFAIPPYKYDDLSPLVKPYQQRLPEIERFRRQAAEKVLATGQCGRVESVEVSEKSTKNGVVILIDCSSAKKFYISEAELVSALVPVQAPANPEVAPVTQEAPSEENSGSPAP
ncbi:MAG: DUF4124 domain-containing protein [Gammaproteobacteria bacterium]|nr:DUF4124 domain-containing protein [Gammaproteobacteria bacterium]